jgi:hypothetical protein
MYQLMTASYDEANARANSTNANKVFAYTILDKDFHEVESGFCTDVRRHYDPCYDCNEVSFTDIDTHQVRCVQQFYVRMKEVG